MMKEDKPWSAGVRRLQEEEKKRLGGALGDVDRWLVIATEPLVALGHRSDFVGEPGQQQRITHIKITAGENGVLFEGRRLRLTGDFFRTTVTQRNPRGEVPFNDDTVMILAKVV